MPRPCMDPDRPAYSDQSIEPIDGEPESFRYVCDCGCPCAIPVEYEGDLCERCQMNYCPDGFDDDDDHDDGDAA